VLVFYRAAFDSDVLLDAVPAEDQASYLPWPNQVDGDLGVAPSQSFGKLRLRQHFPETWLWHSQTTEYNSFINLLTPSPFIRFMGRVPLLLDTVHSVCT
jgi:hypothetical protein